MILEEETFSISMELGQSVWISLQDSGLGFVYGEKAQQREAEQDTYSSSTPYLDTSWSWDKALVFWGNLLHSDDHYKETYLLADLFSRSMRWSFLESLALTHNPVFWAWS